jgi:hypothetical protein
VADLKALITEVLVKHRETLDDTDDYGAFDPAS